MRFHVLKRNIQNLWRRKTIRLAALVIVCIVTIAIQYVAANRAEAIDLTSNKVTIPDILQGERVLLVAESRSNQPLIVHVGKLTEEVDAHFSRARLGPLTLSDFEEQHPPTTAEEIHCFPTNWLNPEFSETTNSTEPENAHKAKPCSTSIALTPDADGQDNVEIALFQTDAKGDDKYRRLFTEVSSQTAVKLKLVPRLEMPFGSDAKLKEEDGVIDCGRNLTVGTWQQRIGGATEIDTIMDPRSTLRTRFSATGLWSGPDGFYEPFSFTAHPVGNPGASNPLKIRELRIESVDGSKTSFAAKSANESLITFDRLRVGSDRLQVRLVGSAFVTKNGELVTSSLLERAQKYQLIAGLVGAANLAILAWCLAVLKSLFR